MPFCSILAPPQSFPTQNQKRRKLFNLKMANILQRTRQWDNNGQHQSISLKGGRELASSQGSNRFTRGVQKEDRRQHWRQRVENYLNLTTFHQGAVELFPGLLCVCAGLKCHKAKTLWCVAEVDADSRVNHRGSCRRRGESVNMRLVPLILCRVLWGAFWHCLIRHCSFRTMNSALAIPSHVHGEKQGVVGSTVNKLWVGDGEVASVHLPLNPSHWK